VTTFTAAQLAAQLGGTVTGRPDALLTGFAHAHSARSGDLTFAENERYFAAAAASPAAAILVDADYGPTDKTLIRVPQARLAFARVLPLFHPEPAPAAGVHPTAVIAPDAVVDATAHVGPHCVIAARARIGPRTALLGGNHVGEDAVVGADGRLFPNVVLYPRTQLGDRVRIHAGSVIGADGYGYVPDEGAHRKVPQVGIVVIHDDVELGANVTVDRGALGATIIGRGTKVDNLVQIAHNVVIGEHCLILSQVGIAGSTRLGDRVTVAGQVGIAGHLHIGAGATISAQSGVMHPVPAGEQWLGYPAGPDREVKRQWLAVQRLPELLRRVAELERGAKSAESG
jgi:UDP-3-O-[3-hydroxymyristoyl] glucosamine N-acyltransferase